MKRLPLTQLPDGVDIDVPKLLSDHGEKFQERFGSELGGKDSNLQNAISALHHSVLLTSDSDPDKPGRLNHLSTAFKDRFELLGDGRDLDQAFTFANSAVALANADRDPLARYLTVLSYSYALRAQFRGSLDDLNSAVSAAERAVSACAEGSPRKPCSLYALATCLSGRFRRLGRLDDVTSAIEMGQLAFSLAEEGEFKRLALDIVAISLFNRFQHSGKPDDLDASISKMKKALALLTDASPQRFSHLKNLSLILQSRFNLFGDPADLDEAIVKGRDAVNEVPSQCPDRLGYLDTLSICLFARFELKGDRIDLAESISLLKDARSSAPDGHIFKSIILHHLNERLCDLFKVTKDRKDIDEAVSAGRDAVACNPDGGQGKASSLIGLATSLQCRFRDSDHKQVGDLDESVTCGEEALSLVSDGDGSKCTALLCLGLSVRYRFDHSQNPLDAAKGISLLKRAALDLAGGPFNRLGAAVNWAQLDRTVAPLSVFEAYKVVIELLPQVAWGESIAARHDRLTYFGPAVNEAAEWAIHYHGADTAVEWLETGRAIVWGQLHNLRSPIDFLSSEHPDLAERLSQVTIALEETTIRGVNTEYFKDFTVAEVGKKHLNLATEWDGLVEEVRALPGFEDFLAPKRFAKLKNAAKLGPVVLVNICTMGCDALILPSDLDNVIIHIMLNDFSQEKAKLLQERLTKAVSGRGARTRLSTPVYSTLGENTFMYVLKELWTCIAKPVLDVLGFSPCDSVNPPRLWWCPTGPLSFLPLHAAGDYYSNNPGTKLSDYVISSYTPTLTILLDKLEKPRTFKGLLAISQPNTPQMSSLPGTEEELQKIKDRATKVPVEYLRGTQATPDTVLQGMSTCNWVHMACHATQQKANSLNSTFHLHPSPNYRNGHLPLSQVIAKSFPDADFAYLSACQTATGDQSLSEESVHLAAGMLMAGYRSVVATLWSINDKDAPLIADDVYSRLFKDGKPDSGEAAIALHHAVQSLRKSLGNEPSSFARWVPFIHVGV
ncbi:CHAT domain-containing protein [Armillaria novae-zelandiae]|uniref:CHAT domain-containing protein n=1 Tax=Armillaria novae-zelandiae TaxID=153914 RepID=A0AA39TZQ6_9AGAR|nr:CHAT domain-containing protein [Armillaria novae-zelandiae]